MRKIYTGIDIGSDSIKIVVTELIKNKFHILASSSKQTKGLKRGLVVDHDLAVLSLKEALDEIEKILGIKINKALVTVPTNDSRFTIVEEEMELSNEITGEDVVSLLNSASLNKIRENEEMVSLFPIAYMLDHKKFTENPVGKKASHFGVKALLAVAPKKQIYDIFQLFYELDVEVVDITFGCIGDYYEAKNSNIDSKVGAIINIGYEKTDISVFNKGILIKTGIVNLGSKNVDKDISYIYGISNENARELKEKFSSSSRRYADINESIEINISDDEKFVVNQYEISKNVEARIAELLKIAKKEINNLTNRKISYIIVTGGITELLGVSYVVENVLGINAMTLNSTTIGARSNKFSSVLGIIKYYHAKKQSQMKDASFVEAEDINLMLSNKKSMLDLEDDTIISKIFGYFANN